MIYLYNPAGQLMAKKRTVGFLHRNSYVMMRTEDVEKNSADLVSDKTIPLPEDSDEECTLP